MTSEFFVPCGIDPSQECSLKCERYEARKKAMIKAAKIRGVSPKDFSEKIQGEASTLTDQERRLLQLGTSKQELDRCARKDSFRFKIVQIT